ncbi:MULTISPECIES: hypothetical protein [unclassified Cupriavidus]|uniref:hypothetical protein n=1 Tax=Cupriavidus sp. H19C3 TaxID=3241603 RepID=UPI003BF77766
MTHPAFSARRLAVAMAAALLGLGLGGCMNTSPVWDAHFGESVRTVRMMQTLNPDASYNTDPVTGVDGRAATYALDRYNQSFSNPPSSGNTFVIGVGGVGGNSTPSP